MSALDELHAAIAAHPELQPSDEEVQGAILNLVAEKVGVEVADKVVDTEAEAARILEAIRAREE